MTRHRSATPALVLKLARVVLIGWLRRPGAGPRRVLILAMAAVAALLAGSAGAAVWLAATESFKDVQGGVGVLPIALVVGVFLMTMLVSISVQGAGSALNPSVRSLVALPIEIRVLSFGLGLPGVALTIALLALLSPPLVVVLVGLTGYGLAHAVFVVATAGLLGLLAGRILFTLVRRALVGSGRLAPLSLTFAIGGWMAVSALSLWRVREMLAAGLEPSTLTQHVALLWPAVGAFALDPTGLSMVVVIGVVVVAMALDWALLGSAAALGLTAPPVVPVRVRFSSTRRAPLFWLEVGRLVRHRRTVAWMLSSALVLAGLIVATATVDAGGRASMVDNAVLIACQLLSYLALLARGMSKRERPYALVLGLDPHRWARTVMLAAGALALVPLVPFLAALAALSRDPSVLPAGIALMVFVLVAASAVGFALVPGNDNAGAEFPAAAAVFAVTVAAGLAISQLIGTTELLPLASIMALVATALAWLPGAIEAARWQACRGIAGPISRLAPWAGQRS